MKYKNLTIIGTSHIAKESLDEVRGIIIKEKPDIVAVELDKKRAYALLHNLKGNLKFGDIWRLGLKGWLFGVLGAWAEKKLGSIIGVSPGSEMKTALKIAKDNKIGVSYIDQDISVTLKMLSKVITWRERWNFVVDIFNAVILRKKELEFDLTKVPSKTLIKKLISKFKKRYPSLYNVLVHERNIYMTKRLNSIINSNPDLKIVAIVGAGHEEDILKLIKNAPKNSFSYSYKISHQH